MVLLVHVVVLDKNALLKYCRLVVPSSQVYQVDALVSTVTG